MSSPKPQESVNGLFVGDTVGVVTRHAGHLGTVEEIIDHDFLKGKSLVSVRLLDSGAIVEKWDTDLQFLPQRIEK